MNWLDIVLIAIIGISLIRGMQKGFARLGVGMVATILAVLFGAGFYGTAGAFILPFVKRPGLAKFLGFFAVFLVVVIAGALVGSLLAKLFKWIGLSWFDRLMGGVLGFARGVLFCIVLLMAMIAFASSPPASVVESQIAPYLIEASSVLAALTPHELKQGFRDGYEKVKKAWVDSFKNGFKKGPKRLPKQEI